MNQPIVTIGLEVHVQLNTLSKLFSPSPTLFGQTPNTMVSEIDLGLPGTLPVLNKEAVVKAILLGISLNAKVNELSTFARKNYFYPDLPKSYQITQDAFPVISDGFLSIDGRKIRIERAHLEEDAGKSIHNSGNNNTLIDLNRAGHPLLEVVTKPDIESTQEAIKYLKKLHHLVRYIDVCDGNMQEGSFRCDANVSIRYNKNDPLGTRVEIKNINSFKFIEKAIDYEISRQHLELSNNRPVFQETRLYNENTGKTISMRSKEDAADYRYFPEPDLPPLKITSELMDEAKAKLPVLPEERIIQLQNEYNLSSDDANLIISSRYNDLFFSEAATLSETKSFKLIFNLMFGELSALMNKHQLEVQSQPVKAKHIARIVDLLSHGEISQPMAKDIINTLWNDSSQSVNSIIDSKGLSLINNEDELNQLINDVLTNNPQQLTQYISGKEKLRGFFVGQLMKITKGKANPEKLSELLDKRLKEELK